MASYARNPLLAELQPEIERLTRLLAGELPVLEYQSEPMFTVPAPVPVRKIIWRDASRGTPAMAQLDILKTGGAWASKKYKAACSTEQVQLQPAFPLQTAQAALRIAAGAINGTTVEIDGVPKVIKGTVKRSLKERVERFTDGEKTSWRCIGWNCPPRTSPRLTN